MHPWHLITRLGEAPIVLPLALLAGGARMGQVSGRTAALRWFAMLALAIVLTTASKLAFIGWGIGSAALDFTGISGHTMFASAIYPVLFAGLSRDGTQPRLGVFVALGCVAAAVVGVSRLALGVHSASEVVAGWLVGGAASLLVLAKARELPARVNAWALVALAAWLALMPVAAPPVETHSMVTTLALRLSGRDRPYTRADMLRAQAAAREALR